MNEPLSCIGLFSGIGGLELGAEQAGFEVLLTVDIDPLRVKVLKLNKPDWNPLEADIRKLTGREIFRYTGLKQGELDLLMGGPPCQPFSKARLWLGYSKRDRRVNLILEFVRLVNELKPRAFLIENVPHLAGKLGHGILKRAFNRRNLSEYKWDIWVLDAAKYGVPQRRRRMFLVGIRRDVDGFPSPPKPTHGIDGKKEVSAGEAIGPLDDGVVHDHEVPNGKWGHLLAEVPPGWNYLWFTEVGGGPKIFKPRSRYWLFLLKLDPNRPSWTITSRPGPYTGPFHWRSRRLRIPEIKRLQAFPLEWKLVGSESKQRQQLGDAVPPLLAKHVVKQIAETLRGEVIDVKSRNENLEAEGKVSTTANDRPASNELG